MNRKLKWLKEKLFGKEIIIRDAAGDIVPDELLTSDEIFQKYGKPRQKYDYK